MHITGCNGLQESRTHKELYLYSGKRGHSEIIICSCRNRYSTSGLDEFDIKITKVSKFTNPQPIDTFPSILIRLLLGQNYYESEQMPPRLTVHFQTQLVHKNSRVQDHDFRRSNLITRVVV